MITFALLRLLRYYAAAIVCCHVIFRRLPYAPSRDAPCLFTIFVILLCFTRYGALDRPMTYYCCSRYTLMPAVIDWLIPRLIDINITLIDTILMPATPMPDAIVSRR